MLENRARKFPVILNLSDGRELSKFLAQMRFGFKLTAVSRDSNASRLRFITAGRQIASLEGGKMSSSTVKKLIRKLGGEFAYRGTNKDYTVMPPGARNRISFVQQHLDKHKKALIYSRDRLVLLEKDQMAESMLSVRPIVSNANLLFEPGTRVVFP